MASKRHRKRCLRCTSVGPGGRERFEQFAHRASEAASGINLRLMALDLDPPQPEPVERAIELLLADGQAAVDPWWAAGLGEALRSDDGAAAKDAWCRPGVVEP